MQRTQKFEAETSLRAKQNLGDRGQPIFDDSPKLGLRRRAGGRQHRHHARASDAAQECGRLVETLQILLVLGLAAAESDGKTGNGGHDLQFVKERPRRLHALRSSAVHVHIHAAVPESSRQSHKVEPWKRPGQRRILRDVHARGGCPGATRACRRSRGPCRPLEERSPSEHLSAQHSTIRGGLTRWRASGRRRAA